jgi:hypothetical protein
MGDVINTRALFQIRAVVKETDEVVFNAEVVAEGEKEALYESDMKEVLKKAGLGKDDVHILVKSFGTLPPKEVVKNVKIIGAAGGFTLTKDK